MSDKAPRCPDCKRVLVLERGVWECQRCHVGWTIAAVQGWSNDQPSPATVEPLPRERNLFEEN